MELPDLASLIIFLLLAFGGEDIRHAIKRPALPCTDLVRADVDTCWPVRTASALPAAPQSLLWL